MNAQEAAAAMLAMQAQIAHLQQVVQSQHDAAIAAAAAAGANAAAASASRPSAVGPRLAAPAPYEGKAAALDDWLADLTQQFDWYTMTDPALRVRFASAYLRGAARDWWTHLSDAERPADWAAMVAALRRQFQPVNSAEQARAKLALLVQGKRNVNEYIADFRRLIVLTPDMAAADRMFFFKRGLQEDIAVALRISGSVTTLEDAIAMATRVGGVSDFTQASAAGSAGKGAAAGRGSGHAMDIDVLAHVDADTPTAGNSAPGSGAASDAPVTQRDLQLLLAAMRDGHRHGGGGAPGKGGRGGRSGGDSRLPRNLPRIPHLTPLQVKEYMDSGKCFTCGSKEHRGRDCPQRQQGN